MGIRQMKIFDTETFYEILIFLKYQSLRNIQECDIMKQSQLTTMLCGNILFKFGDIVRRGAYGFYVNKHKKSPSSSLQGDYWPNYKI